MNAQLNKHKPADAAWSFWRHQAEDGEVEIAEWYKTKKCGVYAAVT